ncbi:sialic acid-binding Ig-like lectin 14 isoform X1 [Gadus morhua]|uniref:sialic acid-binding Ig-like lectin 14 isoform X1 n=1 Tax=Gadus morhua TaxID=8049 RepID=UPI0011B535E8|nr:sialic acid-binding Ig-like lectin 14 isoform X1 [Gadus morhua]XP_030207496.1 sialic acid-binding Ig-like lectin 14 isoform X1 [Gadus morhua]
MKLRSSARGFLAFLLSLPGPNNSAREQLWALKADDWITYPSSNVCAPRGSTVHISCHYECPRNPNINLTVKDKKWFSQRDVDVKTDTDYAGRVEYKCSRPSCTSHICNANCTLSISDLRQSDSSEYKFRFKTYQVGILEYAAGLGVTLSVTDLEVKVSSPMRNNPSWVVLECHSMCGLAGNPTYIWIRNGQSAGEGMKYPGIVWSQYSYSCAVKGYEHFPSPSVYAPKTPSVIVSPSGEIVEGSSLTLSCSSDANPAADYTWFKHGDSVGQSGQNYTITNITSELGGNYYCQAHNAIGRHDSTFLFINWKERSSSSQTTAIAVRAVAVLLASILLLVAILWMRKKASSKASRMGTDTVDEPLSDPVYENVLALTNLSAPAAQREPTEGTRCVAGSRVHSDQI